MESLQGIKSRLKAIKNVGQITKAMEVVAATKMRKAQESALNTRPYAFEALHLLERLMRSSEAKIPLTEKRLVERTAVVVVASDKGLAGSFNSQIFRLADNFFARDEYKDQSNHEYLLISVGKKADVYAHKKKYQLVKTFQDFGDVTGIEEVKPLSDLLFEGFTAKKWDRVVVISTNFRSALRQDPLVRQILPVDFNKIKETVKEIIPETGRYAEVGRGHASSPLAGGETDYIFEPSPQEVFNSLIPHLIEMQFFHIFLEAKASEHSARRVAMKTASDNATELSQDLTLLYNKARQVGITGEIMEITSTITTLEK